MALNQLFPQNDTYRVRPDDMDQQFLAIYSTILQNLRIMDSKAETLKHRSYGVIAKVLTAYTLGYVTDMWDDIPWSHAFNGALHPVHDKQEDVCKTLQSMLNYPTDHRPESLCPRHTTPLPLPPGRADLQPSTPAKRKHYGPRLVGRSINLGEMERPPKPGGLPFYNLQTTHSP